MTKDPKNPAATDNQDTEAKKGLPEIIGGGANSFQAKMMRQMAEAAPVKNVHVDLSVLDIIDVPSVEGEVRVPALPEITEDEVMGRFESIYFDTCVKRTPRKNGEAVKLGDEIVIDLISYHGGKIVPFNSHAGLRVPLEADTIFAGVGAQLEGTLIGETKVIPAQMPTDDGEPAKVAFVVQILGASELEYPQADAPDTLKMFGMGDTLDEIYGNIAEGMAEERANLRMSIGMSMALDALAGQVTAEIPEELVEAEIRSQWTDTEGRFLMDKGLSRQDMDDSLEGWLNDEETRQTALQRLKIGMVLIAHASKHGEDISVEEVDAFFTDFAAENGIDLKEWRKEVAKDEEQQAELLDQYLQLRTITEVVATVNVQYD